MLSIVDRLLFLGRGGFLLIRIEQQDGAWERWRYEQIRFNQWLLSLSVTLQLNIDRQLIKYWIPWTLAKTWRWNIKCDEKLREQLCYILVDCSHWLTYDSDDGRSDWLYSSVDDRFMVATVSLEWGDFHDIICHGKICSWMTTTWTESNVTVRIVQDENSLTYYISNCLWVGGWLDVVVYL